MDDQIILGEFCGKSSIRLTKAKYNTLHDTWNLRGRNSTCNTPYSPFSLSTTNITHDGGGPNGSKQVDSHLTLYKKK